MQVLLIDNHDSFSAILFQYLWELTGVQPLFQGNDALTREELKVLQFDAAVLSPGPGHPANPRDFGICRDLLELYPKLPILGVCLGHQGLAHFAGGKVIPLKGALHGRPGSIRHNDEGVFSGLPQNFQAVRYHSLVVDAASLPENVQVTAWSEEDEQVMGLQFTDRPWFGVQFHPESIGTEYGKALLANFLEIAEPECVNPTISSTESHVGKSGEDVHFRELFWKEPESVFAKHFSTAPLSFWLDGSHPGSNAGWSATYMGLADSVFEWYGNSEAFQIWYDSLDLNVSKQAPWPGYCGGPVGYFAYESGGKWMVPEGYLVFDHSERRVFAAWEKGGPPSWLQAIVETWGEEESVSIAENSLPPFSEWKPLLPQGEYTLAVRALQEFIASGDTYEACLTHVFSTDSDADPFAVFLSLRKHNPSPYAVYLSFPDLKILSASPELFLELSHESVLRSRPIKGTRPRGQTIEEDDALQEELANNPKDRAENLMIVDLTRHDFSRVCALCSVEVSSFMEVEAHPAVLQLVSEVQGRLDESRHPLEAIGSCFPGGSMTGAPKERTMELLASLERAPRGVFSGALGYFTHGGAFTLSMVIRTLENRGSSWRIGCGGAVLADSDPEAEWREATLKARSVIDAVS